MSSRLLCCACLSSLCRLRWLFWKLSRCQKATAGTGNRHYVIAFRLLTHRGVKSKAYGLRRLCTSALSSALSFRGCLLLSLFAGFSLAFSSSSSPGIFMVLLLLLLLIPWLSFCRIALNKAMRVGSVLSPVFKFLFFLSSQALYSWRLFTIAFAYWLSSLPQASEKAFLSSAFLLLVAGYHKHRKASGLQPIASFPWICWEVFKFAIRYAAFDQCCQLLDFVLFQPFHRLHRQQLCHGDEISLQLWSKSKWDHTCWLNMVPLQPLPNIYMYIFYLSI